MKTILIFFTICLILIGSQTTYSRHDWAVYKNARFGYTVSYPTDLFSPEAEADNGDGRVFTGESAEMRVFGSNLLSNETLLGEFNALIKTRETISYKIYRKDYFVVSGIEDKKIFYQKTIVKSGAFATLLIEYDESKRIAFDKIVARIANGFK